jgi:phosphohistidine phosphatase SixA
MRLPENILLIRHGHHLDDDAGLTRLGRWQAMRAAETLIVEGFDKHSSMIASTAIRCVATAEIIAKTLHLESEIVYNQKLSDMEEYGYYLANPVETIGEIAEANNLPAEKDSKLAVIGHGGMILRMIPDLEVKDIANGCVHKLAA